MLDGAVSGTLLAAAIYSSQAWASPESPAIARSGPGGQSASSGDYGQEVTDNPEFRRMVGEFRAECLRCDLSRVRFYGGGDVVGSNYAASIGDHTIIFRAGFFDWDPALKYLTFAHEGYHVVDYGLSPSAFQAYHGAFERMFGSYGNPLEVAAETRGAGFASRVLGYPVPPAWYYGNSWGGL